MDSVAAGPDREAFQAEGIACYRMFVAGLLDLTDNLVQGTTRHPGQLVCYDGEDSYLVVAADKGTATFSDIANEVAALVLAHNTGQNTQLGVSRAYSASMVSVHARLITHLETRHGLDRSLSILLTRAQCAARESAGEGLASPELSVLMAQVKLGLTSEVLASDLDTEVFRARLPEYFPVPLRNRFAGALREHPLRREITTTLLVNEIVDRPGITYVYRLAEDLAVPAPDAVRACSVAVAVFDDLYAPLRKVTLDVLRTSDTGAGPESAIAAWEQKNSSRLFRARVTFHEISDAGSLDLAALSVAVRALARL